MLSGVEKLEMLPRLALIKIGSATVSCSFSMIRGSNLLEFVAFKPSIIKVITLVMEEKHCQVLSAI